MKKKLAGLCGLLTAATFMTAALPPVAPVAHAGIDWGKVIGDVITGAAKTGNNGSNSSGSGSPSPGIGNLSSQKHAHKNPTNDEKLFMLAVEKHDLETVKEMLSNGVDINGVYGTKSDGVTAFLVALRNDDRAMMDFLIENGADPKGFYMFNNYYVSYFLIVARDRKDVEILQYFLDLGVDVNIMDYANHANAMNYVFQGMDALMGSTNNALEKARFLIDKGIDVDNIPKENFHSWAGSRGANYSYFSKGRTPFLGAVSWRYTEMLDLLAAHGANVNVRDSDGKNAMDLAIEHNDINFYKHVQAIVEKGTQPSKYRELKSAEQNKQLRIQEIKRFDRVVSDALQQCNKAFDELNKYYESGETKDYKKRANVAKKNKAKVDEALKKFKEDTAKMTFDHCTAEEKNLIRELIDGTITEIGFETVDRELTMEEKAKSKTALEEYISISGEMVEKYKKLKV